MIVMIGGKWVRLPLEILNNERLTKTAAAVFAVIADKADGGTVQLTAAEIATAVGCCVRSVKTAVKALEKENYISVEHEQGGASIYKQLLLEPKRRSRAKKTEKDDFDASKYEIFINKGLEVK